MNPFCIKYKIINFTLFYFLVIVLNNFPQSKSVEDKTIYTAAFYSNPFDDVNSNDAIVAYNTWFQEINLNIPLKVKLYKDFSELSSIYEKDNIVIAIIATTDYLSSNAKNYFQPMFAPTINNKPGTSYLLITKKEKKLNLLNDLHNLSLGYNPSYTHSAGSVWLDILLYKNKLPKKENFFSKIDGITKESKVIMDVFFGKLDACLVSEASFDLITELNPQISKQLKIMDKSQLYINGFLCFSKDKKNKSIYDELKKRIINMSKYDAGKQILQILKVNNITPYKEEYIDSFVELIKRAK